MKNNFMVDIETLGTSPFSIILSIGVVAFDIKSGETGNQFYHTIDVASSKEVGLTSDQSTVDWWAKQDKSVRDALTKNTKPLPIVLKSLSIWLDIDTHDEICMWGNSARFDLGLLENAYSKCMLPYPWKFYNERCCRTIASLNPKIKEAMGKPKGAHHPIVDCLHQIEYVVKTIQSHERKENSNRV